MTTPLILASGSPHRRKLLADAGIEFEIRTPDVDERAIEAPLLRSGVGPEDRALVLAEAKAVVVSEMEPDAIVIGADQTLSLGDEALHKPANMDEARRRLLALSGRTHQLSSALVLAQGSNAIWRHVSVASMTMRRLEPAFIGRHLAQVGETALSSTGAYQIEGPGIQLFERIEGDYFTIVGLPLLPLLHQLRALGVIDG